MIYLCCQVTKCPIILTQEVCVPQFSKKLYLFARLCIAHEATKCYLYSTSAIVIISISVVLLESQVRRMYPLRRSLV
ncbi:hypothetical protein SCLCIDRAFT_706989 [Scleroderma citrinum Foug A]|uniref:Uncharacterized protein n=1 Tax=Scleroderma citrinum Foug A TaxID=1036808 RepID=A0A0C3E9P3_9AGAM|nr:hypothetical protein SCLCIDRAFT_706989 [Scleroderma citrinum Foug A]